MNAAPILPNCVAWWQGNNLMAVMPKDRAGHRVATDVDWCADLVQQPRHVPRPRDMICRTIAEPADAATLGAAADAVALGQLADLDGGPAHTTSAKPASIRRK